MPVSLMSIDVAGDSDGIKMCGCACFRSAAARSRSAAAAAIADSAEMGFRPAFRACSAASAAAKRARSASVLGTKGLSGVDLPVARSRAT